MRNLGPASRQAHHRARTKVGANLAPVSVGSPLSLSTFAAQRRLPSSYRGHRPTLGTAVAQPSRSSFKARHNQGAPISRHDQGAPRPRHGQGTTAPLSSPLPFSLSLYSESLGHGATQPSHGMAKARPRLSLSPLFPSLSLYGGRGVLPASGGGIAAIRGRGGRLAPFIARRYSKEGLLCNQRGVSSHKW